RSIARLGVVMVISRPAGPESVKYASAPAQWKTSLRPSKQRTGHKQVLNSQIQPVVEPCLCRRLIPLRLDTPPPFFRQNPRSKELRSIDPAGFLFSIRKICWIDHR